jgi:hypothetical protein
MALVGDFWALRAEMLELRITLANIEEVVVKNPRYAKQYAFAMNRLKSLEDDMINVIEELNHTGEMTIDIQASLPGELPEIQIIDINNIENWWSNSTTDDRLYLMMTAGIRKEIAVSFIHKAWRDVGLGVKEKLEMLS